MNIQILDSWIRDYLQTKATSKKFAECMSLTSVSIEKMVPFNNDVMYDIEVTQNRPDLMSAVGLAREASIILPRFGIDAEFLYKKLSVKKETSLKQPEIEILNDPELVGRIMCVIFEVTIKKSPQKIADRLENAGIRSLNNVIDITNYVMRDIGHPTHVFDYDRLTTQKLIIRESRKGEKLTTLDNKEYTLDGGDIVIDDGTGSIIDLMGIMGTKNSVVTDDTQRILFFIDSVDPVRIRKTSTRLGIRSEAAVLNEKGLDPELAEDAMARGITLFKEIANAKQISSVLDLYPTKKGSKVVQISKAKIDQTIGVEIPHDIIEKSLGGLGFFIHKENKDAYTITPPSWRAKDIVIQEDIIEEVARIYGYHNIPNILPPISYQDPYIQDEDEFYWEKSIKTLLKHLGFTEVYTYSMVSENLFEGPLGKAVTIQNELSDDRKYMRRTLVPSLLEVIETNSTRETIHIFEMAKVYKKQESNLPTEIVTLAGVVKEKKPSFYSVKGIIESIFEECGISNFSFGKKSSGGEGADILLDKRTIGEIEILDDSTINFEVDFDEIKSEASSKKVYRPISKFTPIIEDVRLTLDPKVTFFEITSYIQNFDPRIERVILLDTYNSKRTFRITYRSDEKQLTNEDVAPIREKLYEKLMKDFGAQIS